MKYFHHLSYWPTHYSPAQAYFKVKINGLEYESKVDLNKEEKAALDALAERIELRVYGPKPKRVPILARIGAWILQPFC